MSVFRIDFFFLLIIPTGLGEAFVVPVWIFVFPSNGDLLGFWGQRYPRICYT